MLRLTTYPHPVRIAISLQRVFKLATQTWGDGGLS